MKKILIAFLVLTFVSSTSAAIIKPMITSVHGQPITPVSEITIGISCTIGFDIVLVDAGNPLPFELMAMDSKVSATGPGTLDLSQLTWIYNEEGLNYIEELAPGKQYEVATLAVNGMNTGIVVDHLLLHCDGPGDVIISVGSSYLQGGSLLVDCMEYPGDWGSVTVHQIPEPITIAFFGLGGLFLRYRK